MIDTIKLLIKVHDPSIMDGSRFQPLTFDQLVKIRRDARTYYNPSSTYEKMGKYMPRLTMYRRPPRRGSGVEYQLAVEFSAPKMLFNGSNFDELEEDDFERLVEVIIEKLDELLHHKFFPWQIRQAMVSTWHPSKNIVFLDYTSCQTILHTMAKLDVNRTYDFQKDRYRDGHVLHIHANSIDIAFYDKMADLRQAKRSDKRAFEDKSLMQLNLLEELKEYRPLEVFRYEVRLTKRRQVKAVYPELKDWTFEELFKKELCQKVLIKYWKMTTGSVDMLSLDAGKPYDLLKNYLADNPDDSLKRSMSSVLGLLIANEEGSSALRNVIEAHFGTTAWHRLKNDLRAPKKHRYKAFLRIEEQLKTFTPVRFEQFKINIENAIN